MDEKKVTTTVRDFYDKIGWQIDESGMYQNASYEDLRPVSAEYIHRCHMRVKRHLPAQGAYLLDAGSGPVQYSEYVTYSEKFQRRICFDLSIVALREARKKLGEKGFYVVGDVSSLPFRKNAFDGIVSLHTIHHLPLDAKVPTYVGLYQCLKPGGVMATVDGWGYSPLMSLMNRYISFRHSQNEKKLHTNKPLSWVDGNSGVETSARNSNQNQNQVKAGTFVEKSDAKWFKTAINGRLPFKIRVWRSVSTRFLRSMIHPEHHGRFWLKCIYCLEEIFPRFLGENGSYPLITFRKPK